MGSCLTALALAVGSAGCDDEYPVEEFIDDLYLVVEPKPAGAGATIRFFVEGEPPIRLRAHKYVDVLSIEEEPLYRITARGKGEGMTTVPYPLPDSYRAPSGTERLQSRQTVRLPKRLRPGRYILEGALLAVRPGRARNGGTPRTRLTVVGK